jgi:serine/threonine protein phosphatase PrpC
MADQSLWERPLPPEELIPLGITLARLLAKRHAVGRCGGLSGLTRSGGAYSLGPETVTGSAVEDVRALGRLLLEATLVRLPRDRELSDENLLSHICLVQPDFPPDLAAVLSDAIAPDPGHRPSDAIALWARLARAQAAHSVRIAVPPQDVARWSLGHDTHIGLYKSRLGQTNQDHLFYQTAGRVGILAVADGISISTAGSGNLASSILIQVVASLWESQKDALRTGTEARIRAFLDEALATANNTICNGSIRLADGRLGHHIPMGTTAVIALFQGTDVFLATLGDSRAYLINATGVGLLTGDQNLRGEWLRSWQTDDPIELHNEGHALVGYAGHFDIDGTPAPIQAVVRRLRMLPGESLLLCSDGLNDYAADSHAGLARLITTAMAGRNPFDAARELVGRANAGGGGDNITVLIATCDGL